jgi:hypothetical protein
LNFIKVLVIEIIIKIVLTALAKKFIKGELIKNITANVIKFTANCFIAAQVVIIFTSMTFVIYFVNIYKETNNSEKIDFSRRTVEKIGAYLLDRQAASTVMLKKIMDEIETKKIDIDGLHDEEYRNLALNICRLFDKKENVDTREEHYLRNHFSRAPDTLSGMIDTINSGNETFKWKLLTPDYAVLHMYGKGGEYNIKFISEDGHFEAVYDKDGVLLTEYNDPLNMGTFNYADQVYDREKHSVLDVVPYIRWGNIRGTSMLDGELDSEPSDFNQNSDAVERYNAIYKLVYGRDYIGK